MPITREQTLCIVTPHWPAGDHPLRSASLHKPLRALLQDVGVVHFATLALLPGRHADDLPALCLEIVVDEGLQPAVLLERLASHPDDAMWALYAPFFGTVPPAGTHRRALLDLLVSGLSVADGAFVGARDRSVRQIAQERRLFKAVRAQAAMLSAARRSANRPLYERAELAGALRQWALSLRVLEKPEAAPRSYWRGAAAAPQAKVGYFLAIGAAVMAIVWVLRFLGRWLSAIGRDMARWLGATPAADSPPPEDFSGRLVSEPLTVLLEIGARLWGTLLVAAIVYWLLWIALPAFAPPVRRGLDRFLHELDRPADTPMSRLAYAVGWLLLVPFALLLVETLAYVAIGRWLWISPVAIAGALVGPTLTRWLPLLALGVIAVLAWRRQVAERRLATPPAAAGDGLRLTATVRRWLTRPVDDRVLRAQQVHPSIERCEAELVGRVSHMISVTELRRPYAWSAFWTRASLRLVTWLGRLFSTEGRLGDAPGIHFAHWHIVDEGRRLVFLSNFDGYFGGYLDDFINGARSGVNLAWRWTWLPRRPAAAPGHPDVPVARRFPPTRFGIFCGAKCELRFKAFARDSMVPHLFYFDVSTLSLDQKLAQTALRDALYGPRSDAADDLILRKLES